MGAQRRKSGTPPQKARDKNLETKRLIDDAIDSGQLDELRKLAAEHGLLDNKTRRRAWPLLAGAGEPLEEEEADEYLQRSMVRHRDSSTVRVDVERSLWTFADDEQRPARRKELERLLNATVNMNEGDVFYYQGLHDVASVLLLVLGEAGALPLLQRLATSHLRDCTRATLDPALELLQLLPPLLAHVDRELARHLAALDVPSFFALSWLLTWFSHTVGSLPDAARLFDLFLASHPLMPLYLGVAAMHASRDQLLECTEMPEAHHALHNLLLADCGSLDHLVLQALKLMRQVRPSSLVARAGVHLVAAVTPDAALLDGVWHVPPQPQGARRRLPTLASAQWAARRLLVQAVASSSGKVMLTSLLGITSLVALGAMLVRMPQQQGGASVHGAWGEPLGAVLTKSVASIMGL